MTPALDFGLEGPLRAALELPRDAPSLALVGASGTGKTFALVRRALQLASDGAPVLLTAPSDSGVARLRALAGDASLVACAPLGRLAFEVLRLSRPGDQAIEEIDEARAAILFESVGADLFSLEWAEFVSAEIDPEITGMRAPERFADAAFRLIRKLRSSLVSPEEFKRLGLSGATEFYAHPPHFSNPDLLMATSERYRDSLRVTPAELERQRLAEIDLVRVLAHLYDAYLTSLVDHGWMTAIDAVYEATHALRADEALRGEVRSRYAAAAVDDAQDLTRAQIALLEAIFGAELRGVTLAGDEMQATRGFAIGAAGSTALRGAATTIVFERDRRSLPEIGRAARFGHDPAAVREALEAGDAVAIYRAPDPREEERYVADEVVRLLATGVPAARIAVVVRNLRCAHGFFDALLARDVPLDVAGAINPFDFPIVGDALAALWAAVDPFRHDYLLRNLQCPWLRLSDASIAALCADPPDAQPLLFELPEEIDDEARAARSGSERALRLGRNVTGGDVDASLDPEARERVVAFRQARERWETAARSLPIGALARLILDETALGCLPPNARGRFERSLIDRLLAAIDAFEVREPLASLDDFLAYAAKVAAAETDLLALEPGDPDAVRVLDVEAAKGYEFEAVFVPGLRAGAWPRYYSPDAFLFMPSAGMIAKDNVGESSAARTAKFTYALYRYKLKEKYHAEERRAFYCAASRARRRLFLSASGTPTKGVGAPEMLAEFERQA